MRPRHYPSHVRRDKAVEFLHIVVENCAETKGGAQNTVHLAPSDLPPERDQTADENAMTSPIDEAPAASMTRRSIPSAIPPEGGMEPSIERNSSSSG